MRKPQLALSHLRRYDRSLRNVTQQRINRAVRHHNYVLLHKTRYSDLRWQYGCVVRNTRPRAFN